jgi:hypothetical protein
MKLSHSSKPPKKQGKNFRPKQKEPKLPEKARSKRYERKKKKKNYSPHPNLNPSLLEIHSGFYPWGSVGFVKCSAQHVRNARN